MTMDYWKWFFFSFKGRISRKQWWLSRLAIIGFAVAVFGITSAILNVNDPGQETKPHPIIATILVLTIAVPWFWAGLACEVKRWHDCNKPWIWVLIAFVPIIGPFWVIGVLGFRRSTRGPNDYGDDPVAD
jgi:uncharacterized membrane protein YhaH (DUF805 family)